jgi:hypothetical protein
MNIEIMKYILVEWPDSQMLMEEEWFNKCYLSDDSAYFVPENRWEELLTNIKN